MNKELCEVGDCIIEFKANCSEDEESYLWEFGVGELISHSFEKAGIYIDLTKMK